VSGSEWLLLLFQTSQLAVTPQLFHLDTIIDGHCICCILLIPGYGYQYTPCSINTWIWLLIDTVFYQYLDMARSNANCVSVLVTTYFAVPSRSPCLFALKPCVESNDRVDSNEREDSNEGVDSKIALLQ
jgi:hypothetical protein